MTKEQIFIIDTNSQVHNLADNHGIYTYHSIATHSHIHFPYFPTKAIELELNGDLQKVKKRFKKRLKTKVELFEDQDDKGGFLSTITTNECESEF